MNFSLIYLNVWQRCTEDGAKETERACIFIIVTHYRRIRCARSSREMPRSDSDIRSCAVSFSTDPRRKCLRLGLESSCWWGETVHNITFVRSVRLSAQCFSDRQPSNNEFARASSVGRSEFRAPRIASRFAPVAPHAYVDSDNRRSSRAYLNCTHTTHTQTHVSRSRASHAAETDDAKNRQRYRQPAMSDPQSLAQSGAAGVAPIVDSTPSPSAGARAAASGDSFDKVAAASSAAATFDSGFISSASVGFSSADLSAEQQPQSSAADDNCRQPIASSSSSSSVRAAEQPPQKSAPFIDSGLCDAADEEPSSTDSSMHLDKQSAAKEWTCTGPQLDGRNNLSTVSTPSDDGTKQRHAAACKTDVADAFILKQYRSLWKMIFLQDSNGDT